MAETYTVSGDQETNLLRLYERTAVFEPLERSKPRFWNKMKAVPNSRPGGRGLFFKVIGAKGHGVGAPGETGDFSTPHTRAEVLCQVTSAQLDSVVNVSMKYQAAAEGQGSFSGDADEDLVLEAMESLLTWADILMGAGSADGKLAEVFATIVATNVFRCTLPDGVYKLRPNQPIDFVDGANVVQAQSVIHAIDYQRQEITLEDNVSLTAGWGVYQRDTIGSDFPNGVLNIDDDGQNAATIYGKARSDFPYLAATVIDHGMQDYTEEMVDGGLDQVTFNQDLVPTLLRSNKGLITEHKLRMVSDRTFIQSGDKPPDYNVGSNFENLAFIYGSVKIPWEVDRNLPARTLFAHYMPAWGRCVLRDPDWVTGPNGKPFMLKPAAGGDTWSYSLIGSLMMDVNIRSKKPKADCRWDNVKDRFAAGIEDAA